MCNRVVRFFLIGLFLFIGSVVSAQTYSWEAVQMDGSRVGAKPITKDNIEESLGVFKKGKYISPNGNEFKKSSTVAKLAEIIYQAQPKMAELKEVIAQSDDFMSVQYPESSLSNWTVDLIMDSVEELTENDVDMGITNFGGIRISMPKGDVLLDDLKSMFPFRNQLIYLELKGADIRDIVKRMAETRFQVLGGVEVVVEDGELVKFKIDGDDVEDDKIYGVATISFLLYGGDGLYLAEKALKMIDTGVDVFDAVYKKVCKDAADGKNIAYQKDNRVIIKD